MIMFQYLNMTGKTMKYNNLINATYYQIYTEIYNFSYSNTQFSKTKRGN